ncbi:MAG: Mpo1-like protein [Polyangiales bacterium]
MQGFLAALEEQRWDDHRYYHHNRVNQSLHVVSALCFLTSYVLLFTHPAAAALVGWTLAMVSRQIGHFFFEPKGYDDVNQATFAYKEQIKVGYNLHRKQVLLGIWALTPLLLLASPSLFGVFEVQPGIESFLDRLSKLWLALGAGALLFRVAQLCVIRDVQTGVVWFVKILTDPFHDIKLYRGAPLAVLRGELMDPAHAARAESSR